MANTQAVRRREILTLSAFCPSWIGNIWTLKLYWQPRKGCGRMRVVTLVPFCANSSASNAFNSRQTTDAALGEFWSGNLEFTAVTRPTAIEAFDLQKMAERKKKVYFGGERCVFTRIRGFLDSKTCTADCTHVPIRTFRHRFPHFGSEAVQRCVLRASLKLSGLLNRDRQCWWSTVP